MQHGIDINAADQYGKTYLMYAVDKPGGANQEIVELILKSGANVNAKNKDGFSALKYATSYNHEDTVKLLLSYDANANIADRDGRTPLMIAAQKGNKEMVLSFLNSGAEINAADKSGVTALTEAAQKRLKRWLSFFWTVVPALIPLTVMQ